MSRFVPLQRRTPQGIHRTWQSRTARRSKNFTGDWNQLIEAK